MFNASAEDEMHPESLDLWTEDSPPQQFCVHCRVHSPMHEPLEQVNKLLRCSRCKTVHYCSVKCQKDNLALHKTYCRKLCHLRQEDARLQEEICQQNTPLSAAYRETINLFVTQCGYFSKHEKGRLYLTNKYELAHTILELAYRSTDTIERGKCIYQLALKEFYEVMRLDPFWPGGLQSTVLLLAFLGHDFECTKLILFLLDPLKYGKFYHNYSDTTVSQTDLIRQHHHRASQHTMTYGWSQYMPYLWIYGSELINDDTDDVIDYPTIPERIPKGADADWNANIFFMPLMLFEIKKMDSLQRQEKDAFTGMKKELQQEIIISVCLEAEYAAQCLLPILLGLFPDGRPWEEEDVALLFTGDNEPTKNEDTDGPNKDIGELPPIYWVGDCVTFWHILKDCYAFTPGLLNILEETVDAMRAMGIQVIPEDPGEDAEEPKGAPTASEYMVMLQKDGH
jgi:hypothetical protein